MTSEELIAQFETGAVSAASFHHADHVRMAFLYLSRYPVLEVLRRFSAALVRFAAANGQPQRYHETITWAYVFLIRERMARAAQPATWEDFRRTNPDLLNTGNDFLRKYYRDETLSCALARGMFLLPDGF
jgi:hypothetical protein